MNRDSASRQGLRPPRASPVQPAIGARDAGLQLIRRINRWLIGGAVAAAGLLSLLAAHAFHGHTVTTRGASSSLSAPQLSSSSSGASYSSPSSSNASGSGLQSPGQAPAAAAAAPAPVVSGGS
jgi:hypothetical protein